MLYKNALAKTNPLFAALIAIFLFVLWLSSPVTAWVIIGILLVILSLRSFEFAYWLTWLAVVGGQLVRLNFPGGGGVILLDLAVGLLLLSWVFRQQGAWKRILLSKQLWFWWGFLIIGLLSWLINAPHFGLVESLAGFGHWARLAVYSLLAGVPLLMDANQRKQIWQYWWVAAGLIVVIGALQLWLVPDLRFLERLGWDPHVNRLAGSFLDPNLLAGFLLPLLGFADYHWLTTGKWRWGVVVVILFVTSWLTFSQGGWLGVAIILIVGLLATTTHKRFWLASSLVVTLGLQLLPWYAPRILGRVNDLSVQARIQSWNNGLSIWKDHFWLGVGYNNLRLARNDYPQITETDSHAAAGVDSSLVYVLATTGALGGVCYIGFWITMGLWLLRNAGKSHLIMGLLVALPAIGAVSLFINLIFFAPMVWLVFNWFNLALAERARQEENDVRV
jgi:hypothetical protein